MSAASDESNEVVLTFTESELQLWQDQMRNDVMKHAADTAAKFAAEALDIFMDKIDQLKPETNSPSALAGAEYTLRKISTEGRKLAAIIRSKGFQSSLSVKPESAHAS